MAAQIIPVYAALPDPPEDRAGHDLNVLQDILGSFEDVVPCVSTEVFTDSKDCAAAIDEFGDFLFEPFVCITPAHAPGPDARLNKNKRSEHPTTLEYGSAGKKRKFSVPTIPSDDVATGLDPESAEVPSLPLDPEPPKLDFGGSMGDRDSIRVMLRRGGLTAKEYRRNEAIPRYLAKRATRNWTKAKSAMYESRTAAASSRRRVKGQFSTTPNMWRSFAELGSAN